MIHSGHFSDYQMPKQIYESADTSVYRAVRKKDNLAVILKILKNDYPSSEALTRFRQEYDITRSLSDLDGVVNACSLDKQQNTSVCQNNT